MGEILLCCQLAQILWTPSKAFIGLREHKKKVFQFYNVFQFHPRLLCRVLCDRHSLINKLRCLGRSESTRDCPCHLENPKSFPRKDFISKSFERKQHLKIRLAFINLLIFDCFRLNFGFAIQCKSRAFWQFLQSDDKSLNYLLKILIAAIFLLIL